MRLADVIERWIGRVEVVLAGADGDLSEGEEALAAGDPMRARAAAHRVLVRAPESPLALALLADACEAAHLDAELALTLEQLARWAPSRAEVWVRLARARAATESPPAEIRDAFVRGLAIADAGSEARRDALLGLADLDLAEGQALRAELWLERTGADAGHDVALRRAEVRLLRGDAAGAAKLLDAIPVDVTDGRAALARGRALAALEDARAFPPLVRAMVLDAPGASEALSSALARLPSDEQTRTHVRSVVDARGEQDAARWRAAFARAEGSRERARRALRDALAAGDRAVVGPLLEASIDDEDAEALEAALDAAGDSDATALVADARHLASALRAAPQPSALDALAAVAHPRLRCWADHLASSIASAWIPPSGAPAAWTDLIARFDAHAHAAGDLGAAAKVAELAAERSGAVRMAVVGEFNAGKSTFINALIGAEVAPTGVLPTTATLHHLRWAPDAFARILFDPGHVPPERLVALVQLRGALQGTDPAAISRVELRLPRPSLLRVEILDTPGFNAPDRRHTEVARAAFDEADIALWLLDASQPLKQSERAILEEAQRARLPVLLCVNKADRLRESELEAVMRSVDAALQQTGLRSWARPLAFSAKRALAARVAHPEDRAALDASNWPAVEALLEREVVARSEELKERSLRRHATALVERLAAAWSARQAAEAREATEAREVARAAGQAAATLEANAEELARGLADSLAPHLETWRRDVELLSVGRDRAAAARDPAVARYRVERGLTALATPLARALASLAPEAEVAPGALAPLARAIVRTAVEVAADDPARLGPVASRAAIGSLVDALFAASLASPPCAPSEGRRRELRAFAAALA